MTTFEFLSVALSLVLGLGVTLILTSFLAAFRNRRTTELDWLPLAWACFVLVYHFQFWWAIFELSTQTTWSVERFALLLVLTVILFLAGGLVLPSGAAQYPQSLADYFEQDGKWGVVAIAVYLVVGGIGNVVLFGSSVVSSLHVLQALAAALSLIVFLSSRRRIESVATVAYGFVLVAILIRATPSAY